MRCAISGGGELAVALDDMEEWAPQVLWEGLTDIGPVLQKLCLLRWRPQWQGGRLYLWYREAEPW